MNTKRGQYPPQNSQRTFCMTSFSHNKGGDIYKLIAADMSRLGFGSNSPHRGHHRVHHGCRCDIQRLEGKMKSFSHILEVSLSKVYYICNALALADFHQNLSAWLKTPGACQTDYKVYQNVFSLEGRWFSYFPRTTPHYGCAGGWERNTIKLSDWDLLHFHSQSPTKAKLLFWEMGWCIQSATCTCWQRLDAPRFEHKFHIVSPRLRCF